MLILWDKDGVENGFGKRESKLFPFVIIFIFKARNGKKLY